MDHLHPFEIDLAEAWQRVGGVPSIYEAFVDFRAELSVVGQRDRRFLSGAPILACFCTSFIVS